MDKVFRIGKVKHSIANSAQVGFGLCILQGICTQEQAEGKFDVLGIGETLIDEDGDEWERVE